MEESNEREVVELHIRLPGGLLECETVDVNARGRTEESQTRYKRLPLAIVARVSLHLHEAWARRIEEKRFEIAPECR